MTDTTDTPVTAAKRSTTTVVHPASGELIDLKAATTTDLADGHTRVNELVDQLLTFRQAIVDEAAGRMDRLNKRKVMVTDELELETNAPSTESYAIDTLRAELIKLVQADVIDRELVRSVIVLPPPTTPAPRVDKRELNKLKAHDDPRVVAAIEAARTVSPQRRTLKVTRHG